MESLFQVASTFPTLTFSIFLGIVVVYWIVGLLGIVDLDLGGDVDVDVDADVGSSAGALTGLFLTFGLTGVPFTLVISIVILLCWLISFYTQFYLLGWLSDGWLFYVVGLVVNCLTFIVSLPIAAVFIKPLKGMFKSVETTSSQGLIGRDAVVATGSVSETFGQAKLFNDGAELLLDVRCSPDVELKQGDKVLLIEYHQENHAYIVAPFSLN